MKKIMILVLFSMTSSLSIAAGLINEMQSCQGLIAFIDGKLNSAPSKYSEADVVKVRTGLQAYSQYIQREIVTPGLLQAAGGDQIRANEFQKNVDTYKSTIVKKFETQYPQNRLFNDQAIGINNCAKKAVPSGQELEALKLALNIMVELAKLN